MAIRSKFKLLLADKEYREQRRIPYEEITKETGIAASTLSRIANNTTQRFYAETLSKLCDFFECQVGDLLEYVPEV